MESEDNVKSHPKSHPIDKKGTPPKETQPATGNDDWVLVQKPEDLEQGWVEIVTEKGSSPAGSMANSYVSALSNQLTVCPERKKNSRLPSV